MKPKNGLFEDVSAYKSGAKKLTMKFLSGLPAGTRINLVMQNSARLPLEYPNGNYAGLFFALTTAQPNTWETLTFTFEAPVGSFDTNVTSTQVDQIAMLIAPGEVGATKPAAGATYYFDDLTGPALATTTTATRNVQTATAAFAAAYPNPTAGLTRLPYSLQKAAVVSLAVFDNLGRRAAQVLEEQRQPAGQFSAELNAARLAPGLYTCRLLVDGVALIRQLSVQ